MSNTSTTPPCRAERTPPALTGGEKAILSSIADLFLGKYFLGNLKACREAKSPLRPADGNDRKPTELSSSDHLPLLADFLLVK